MKAIAQAPYHLCFETLANELRIQIIRALQEKPLTVKEMTEKLGAEQSRLSHSLEMLRLCNYVDYEAQGRERKYSLKKGAIEGMQAENTAPEMLSFADSHFTHYCNHECMKQQKKQ